MLSLKLYGPNDLRLEETEIPEISDGELLLKTDAAAICGTDIRMWKNGFGSAFRGRSLILGHEFSGTVVKTGGDLPAYKVGMRVSLQPNIGCGICDRCVSGAPHLCDDYKAFGINMDGAFAEYVRIPREAVMEGNVLALPENITAAEAAVVEPLSCVYNGQSKCSARPGEYALVVGAGPIGMMHAMLLHMAGVRVCMNDINEERLEACKRILPFLDVCGSGDLREYIMGKTRGRGLDIAITACPVPAVQQMVLQLMNYGGRVNFFGGIPEHKQPVALNTNLIHYKELFITGSTRSSIGQFRKVFDLIDGGLIDVRPVITHQYRLEDAAEAFRNAGEGMGLKHLITFA